MSVLQMTADVLHSKANHLASDPSLLQMTDSVLFSKTNQAACLLLATGGGGMQKAAKTRYQEEDESSSGSLDHPGLAAPRRQRAAGSRPGSARSDRPKER